MSRNNSNFFAGKIDMTPLTPRCSTPVLNTRTATSSTFYFDSLTVNARNVAFLHGTNMDTTVNAADLEDPSGINVDNYGAGWLVDMDCDGASLMTDDEYYQYLDENWEKTQRLIKGKINTLFQEEDGLRVVAVTRVQTCALPI